MNSTAYILEKDGEYFVFESEKSACEYLGVVKCSVSSAFVHNAKCKGYTVIRAKSEKDIYKDDRLWKIWEGMHERCEYEKHPQGKHEDGKYIVTSLPHPMHITDKSTGKEVLLTIDEDGVNFYKNDEDRFEYCEFIASDWHKNRLCFATHLMRTILERLN